MQHIDLSESVALYIMSRNIPELIRTTRYGIAEYFNINQSYLSKLFMHDFNISISSYIDIEKAVRSRILIENTKIITVDNIAEILGIAKSQQFRVKFKKIFCTTPGRFIRIARKRE